MPSIFFYLIVGLIQGILEWLPVSSEGQILLVGYWFKEVSEVTILQLAFFLHLGTLLVVLVKYRNEWKLMVTPQSEDDYYLRSFIIYTTIGTGVLGVPIRLILFDSIENSNIGTIAMWILGIALIFTGLLLKVQDGLKGERDLSDLTIKEQLILGCFQGLTIIPGISRSGTTISVLLAMNCKNIESFRGSFLMSVPAALGAVVLELLIAIINKEPILEGLQFGYVVISILIAFVAGFLTIGGLLKIADDYDFSVIVLSLGIVIILFLVIF